MINFTDVVGAIAQVGFPIVIAIYLLIYQGKRLEGVKFELSKVVIALYLILNKLDLDQDYRNAISDLKEDKGG